MQMTSLYILELLRVHATFNLPKGRNEKREKRGSGGGGQRDLETDLGGCGKNKMFASELDALGLFSNGTQIDR